jgi:hypothetical protein
MSAIAFSPTIGPVFIDCVISERPESTLEITEIPVESGVRITDHAVVAPKRVTLDIANHNAAESFRALVEFQERREPFTLVTGLSVFNSMLIKSISTERDASFSTVLRAKIELQEIVIVETAYDPNASSGSGNKSNTRAATPTAGKASNPATSDKAAQTVNNGDTGGNTPTAKNQSILSGIKAKYAGP